MTQELENKIERMIESLGYVLYDIAFLKENDSHILRISITNKENKITLDMCQEVSEVLSPLLDVEILDEKSYFLEVSSPGVERVLKTSRHFLLSLNQKVQVRLDNKEEFEAILKDYQDEKVVFEINGDIKSFDLKALKKVKTILEW
ncbi:ribosome maturation factor RimP [Helicobacter sp. faydin-H20]|uniref:ribosome maturation factor RimP n=1 Tax=Helicobacter anatolicus TaxID=2905874 RepID=UPI001E2B2B99|nr:ribosome maturation factor RimP [Helicobacter anatolicus]